MATNTTKKKTKKKSAPHPVERDQWNVRLPVWLIRAIKKRATQHGRKGSRQLEWELEQLAHFKKLKPKGVA